MLIFIEFLVLSQYYGYFKPLYWHSHVIWVILLPFNTSDYKKEISVFSATYSHSTFVAIVKVVHFHSVIKKKNVIQDETWLVKSQLTREF